VPLLQLTERGFGFTVDVVTEMCIRALFCLGTFTELLVESSV